MQKKEPIETIDEYISKQPEDVRKKLEELKNLILEIVPDCQEKMSWQMPTFYYYGNLVHFAVAKKHIGFYPTPSAIEKFSDELIAYDTTKGSVHFPMDSALPMGLIRRMVEFRAWENKEHHDMKQDDIEY